MGIWRLSSLWWASVPCVYVASEMFSVGSSRNFCCVRARRVGRLFGGPTHTFIAAPSYSLCQVIQCLPVLDSVIHRLSHRLSNWNKLAEPSGTVRPSESSLVLWHSFVLSQPMTVFRSLPLEAAFKEVMSWQVESVNHAYGDASSQWSCGAGHCLPQRNFPISIPPCLVFFFIPGHLYKWFCKDVDFRTVSSHGMAYPLSSVADHWAADSTFQLFIILSVVFAHWRPAVLPFIVISGR